MRTETRRQKRRTSKHRKRSNRRDEDEIRAWGSENVNNRAIAVRLHAQMIYNNNNNSPLSFAALSTSALVFASSSSTLTAAMFLASET